MMFPDFSCLINIIALCETLRYVLSEWHAVYEHRWRRKMLLSSIRRGFTSRVGPIRTLSSHSEMKDFLDYLDSLKNYEKSGVPKGAGTDSSDGFDLGRMRRLMERFGNPHSKFKVSFLFLSIFTHYQRMVPFWSLNWRQKCKTKIWIYHGLKIMKKFIRTQNKIW